MMKILEKDNMKILYIIFILTQIIFFVVAKENPIMKIPPPDQFGCLEKTGIMIFATYNDIQPEVIQRHLDAETQQCYSLYVYHQNVRKLVRWDDHLDGADQM